MDEVGPSGLVSQPARLPARETRASVCATVLGILLCVGGLTWNALVAPLMDDSDPSTFIGDGLLFFGIPALATAVAAIAARFLPGRLTALSHGLAIAPLIMGAAAIVGLAGYELLFSRSLWSR